MWDYAEVAPFSGSTGTINSGLPYYIKNIQFSSPLSLIGGGRSVYSSTTSLPILDNTDIKGERG